MSETFEFDNTKGLLTVTGELTIYQMTDALDALRAAAASDVLCEIDLTGVTEMDCAGLQWLIQAERLAGSKTEASLVIQKNALINDLQSLTSTAPAAAIDIAEAEA